MQGYLFGRPRPITDYAAAVGGPAGASGARSARAARAAGFTDVERARVVRGCLDTLAARGLFTGTAFERNLVDDLRTVIEPG